MEKDNRSYFKGIIGGILGAIIGSIPLVLLYVFGNTILSLLTIVVAICSLKGYELFKGKIDQKLPWIIAIISFLVIIIISLIVIPNILIYKEFGAISIANFKAVWSNPEFKNAMLYHDLPFLIIFSFLGIGGIFLTIKSQAFEGVKKIDLNYNPYKIKDRDRKRVEDIFIKYNALDKDSGIEKDVIINELEDEEDLFNALLKENIIKVKNNKYYYCKKNENGNKKRIIGIIIFVFIMVFAIFTGILFGSNDYSNLNKEKEDVPNNNLSSILEMVTYDEPNDYLGYEYEKGKIISNTDHNWRYLPSKDISGKSGWIDLAIYTNTEEYTDYNILFETIKNDFINSNFNILDSKLYDNKKNNKIMYIKIKQQEFNEEIYYVFKRDKAFILDGFVFEDSSIDIAKDSKLIAESFDWK